MSPGISSSSDRAGILQASAMAQLSHYSSLLGLLSFMLFPEKQSIQPMRLSFSHFAYVTIGRTEPARAYNLDKLQINDTLVVVFLTFMPFPVLISALWKAN